MRVSAGSILLLALAVGLTSAQPYDSFCIPFTTADFNPVDGTSGMQWYFGSNEGGGSTLYSQYVLTGQYSTGMMYMETFGDDQSSLYRAYPFINQVPIIGGKNLTDFDGIQEGYVPTANFTCFNNHSAMWGPSYPDYRGYDGYIRGRHQNLEVYTYFSAPTETSYIRTIYFIKNTGATAERVQLFIFNRGSKYGTNVSPIDNNQRYYTAFAFEVKDNGYSNTNPAANARWPTTVHAQGQKAVDQTSTVLYDADNYNAGVVYTTTLGAGQEFGFMNVKSFGRNVSTALKTAAEIDAEPEYIFHDLTADQLAMIRNWGGCQVIIGPTATVTVTPPAQCSTTGLTSDFTVQASSSRTDLTADFMHQVVGIKNIIMVPAQSSTTLSVPNDVGAVRHQLWYKGCLVRETEFNSCSTAAPVAPVSAPVASAPTPVANTPSKVNDASSLAAVSVLSFIGAVALF